MSLSRINSPAGELWQRIKVITILAVIASGVTLIAIFMNDIGFLRIYAIVSISGSACVLAVAAISFSIFILISENKLKRIAEWVVQEKWRILLPLPIATVLIHIILVITWVRMGIGLN